MLVNKLNKFEFAFKINDKSLPMMHFFKQKNFGLYVLIVIMRKYYEGEFYEKEKLKDLIFTSSRTTVSNFVSDAVNKEIFILSQPEDDRRKRIIKPSVQLVDEFEEWINIVSN